MNSTSTLILGIGLMIIMWGMGLSLVVNDFKRVVKFPKAVLLGLANQIILLPIIAYLLVKFFSVSEEIAVGVMILAACPGGATSNLMTHLAKGDTALSVSLTAISSLVTIFTLPFIINFGLESFANKSHYVQLNVFDTIKTIFFVVVIPVTLGMLLRRFTEKFANAMEKPVRIASALILIVIILGILTKKKITLSLILPMQV